MFYAIHIDAGHDRNGNPRRAYLVFDADGNYKGTVDEEYKGTAALKAFLDGDECRILAKVPTTAAFRRECLRD